MVVSRRTVLRAALGAGAVAGLEMLATPADAAAWSPTGSTLPHAEVAAKEMLSPNGWAMDPKANAGRSVWSRPVSGTAFDVDVAIGDVETVLVHVIRRFHYEIETLAAKEVVGFKPAPGLRRYERNHASGTAIDIRPEFYPVGGTGNFLSYQVEIIRDILADCEGVVCWGGDFPIPDESHFQIDVPPGERRMSVLAGKIRAWNDTPGLGAGVIQDVNDRRRREPALVLAQIQRS